MITVFAAASLTAAFASASTALPQVRPTFSFGGSQQLVTQLLQGAPADVVATADAPSMERLVDASLVDPPVTFARTTLVIAVRPGNPSGVTGLADLARPSLNVVLADPSVPAGRYTRQVLDDASVRVQPRSLELDVKAALAKVTAGEADAALVYASDAVAAGDTVETVEVPGADDQPTSYYLGVTEQAADPELAQAWVDLVLSDEGRAALQDAGFGTP